MSTLSTILRCAASVAVAFIALMGLMKSIDLPAFARAVREWAAIPPSLRTFVVVAVPAIELSLGIWLLAGIRRRWLVLAAMALVLAFSAMLAAQWALAGKAPCACFGVLARRIRQIETAEFGLARNGVMMIALVGHLMTFGDSSARERRDGERTRHAAKREHRGFTLIETLAVIAILGVLLSLSMPSLARVRNQARGAATASNLRSHGAVFVTYTTDYKDLFPVLTDPRASYSIIRCESAGVALRSLYFDAFNRWNVALADQYYAGAYRSRSFQSGWDPPGPWGLSGLHLACSFSADPAYFDLTTRLLPPAQLRPVRATEVLFPSHKSVLTAYAPWVRFRRVFGGMVDGRAAEFLDRDLLGDVRSGDGAYPQYTIHWPAFTPMTHTVHGVRGRDVR